MKADIVKIGNSRGIRLPAALLKQCGIGSTVELEITGNRIIIKPIHAPRHGWAASFKKMNQCGDDTLLIPNDMDSDLLEDWNES